jgi:predicted metal-binding membrane protein
MPMSGMSMPAHGWLGAYAAFVVQWVGMMAAMMLPSLLPRLWSYGRAVRPAGMARGAALVTVAAAAYLAVWAAIGGLIYPAGVAVSTAKSAWPWFWGVAPVLTGAVVVAAGLLQFTQWKARHLACWQRPARDGNGVRYTVGQAVRVGVRLGGHCTACGAGLTAVMVVLGVMDPRVMMLAAAAVTLERCAPAGARVARALGAVGVVAGAVMMLHASALH